MTLLSPYVIEIGQVSARRNWGKFALLNLSLLSLGRKITTLLGWQHFILYWLTQRFLGGFPLSVDHQEGVRLQLILVLSREAHCGFRLFASEFQNCLGLGL